MQRVRVVSPGFWIAAGFWGLVVVGVLVGLSYDLRRWLRDRRACRRVGEIAERERMARGVAFVEALQATLDEIKALPECEPKRRLV